MNELLSIAAELRDLHAATLVLIGLVALLGRAVLVRFVTRNATTAFDAATHPLMAALTEHEGRLKDQNDRLERLRADIALTDARSQAAFKILDKLRAEGE